MRWPASRPTALPDLIREFEAKGDKECYVARRLSRNHTPDRARRPGTLVAADDGDPIGREMLHPRAEDDTPPD